MNYSIGMKSLIDTFISKCKSQDEFVSKLNSLSDNIYKGNLFERLTQIYLLNTSTYSSKLINVWWCNNKGELPANIQKKLNLPNDDEGIDLICETVDGDFWSIQSKYKANQDKAPTRKELATFEALSFNTCKNISLAIVVHTSNKPVKKSSLMPNVTEIGLDKWLEISEEEWKRLRQYCKSNKLVPPKKRMPRKHQKLAINDAVKHFSKNSNSRGKLIMPCGTGKSLTAFWIAQAIGTKNIIVSVPSLALIRQGLADWTAEYLANGIKPDWIAICADDTVGKTSDADSTVASIYDTGIPTTTNVKTIEYFLKKKTKLPKIVFTTYQSGQKLCEAAKKAKKVFDLLICDEAHKTVGVSNLFSILLFDKNISVKKRVFMTATERVLKTTSSSKEDIISMDNLDNYGQIFHQLSFKEAIKQKIICDYKIVTLAVNEKEAKILINENPALSVSIGKDKIETDAHNISVGIALLKVFEKYKISHAVTFHSSIKRSLFFSSQQEKFLKQTGITNFQVSSQNSAGQRADILRNFTNENKAIISNAKCLTEGVDIPSIDCVVFVDPKQSVVDIVQAAGRAMRQSEKTGKKIGYILLPIIVPKEVNLSNFAETTNFKKISRVITSLSTQDERIADELKEVTYNKTIVPNNIIQIETEFFNHVHIRSSELVNAITTKIWSNVGKANWMNFNDARSFVRSLNLANEGEWRNYIGNGLLPSDIPHTPFRVYKNNGWISFGDWLGTGFVHAKYRTYLSYDDASNYVIKKNITSANEYKNFSKSNDFPNFLPSSPPEKYKNNGWIGWGNFLKTYSIGPGQKKWMSYEDTSEYIKTLKFKTKKEFVLWMQSSERHPGIPTHPHIVYKEFTNYGEWLGTYIRGPGYKVRPYKAALTFVQGLNLKNHKEWLNYIKINGLPTDIPINPERKYKGKGWNGYGEWLGTGRKSEFIWRKFKSARTFARSLKLKNHGEWRVYCKEGNRPNDIPSAPNQVYKNDGWSGFTDWLGPQRVNHMRHEYYSFEKAKNIVSKLGIKTTNEWYEYTSSNKFDNKIPKSPNYKYKNEGWVSYGDWLGTNRVSDNKRIFLSYEEAKTYAHTLKFKYANDWIHHIRELGYPENLPVNPTTTYRNKGWKNWRDFLGNSYIGNQRI